MPCRWVWPEKAVSNPQRNRAGQNIRPRSSSRHVIPMQHRAKIASANQNRLHSQPRRHFDDRNERRRHRDHVDHMASRQALDQRRVLMRVRIVVMLIMLTTAGNLLLMLMTGLRVRTMAMIHRRHLRHPAAIAHKAAMQPKHLRPQHRREGEQGESGMERGAHAKRIWDCGRVVQRHLDRLVLLAGQGVQLSSGFTDFSIQS